MDNKRLDWASVGQLALALIGAVALWGMAAAMLVVGISQLISKGAGDAALSGFMTGLPLAVVGVLMLPSAYYALMRILGKPPVDSKRLLRALRPGWWILAFPVVVLLGYLASKTPAAWLILPPLHVLAIGIPSVWMLYLAVHKLPLGSSQRMWGVLDSGLFLAPALIIVLELLAGLAFLIVAVAYLSLQPGMVAKLTALADQLRDVQSQEAVLQALGSYVVHPLVILGVLAFAGVAVPLIEEFAKPIGVWLLLGRKMTPAAGFVAGALSGAGYGLVESLLLSGSGQDWTSLVVARNGTTAIHMLTSSITGWALVQAWQKRRFLQLGLAYICAILIHGTWNGLTMLYSFRALAQMENLSIDLPLINPLGAIAPFGLVAMAVGCFLGLLAANRVLQRGNRGGPGTPEGVEIVEGRSSESVL